MYTHVPFLLAPNSVPFGEVPTRHGTTHTNITTHHSAAQHSTTQPSQSDPAHYNTHNTQRTVAPLVSCNSAQRSTAPRCERAQPPMQGRHEQRSRMPVSLMPTQTMTTPIRGPTRPPKIPAAQAWGVKGKSRQICVDIWMHPTQSASAREARTSMQGPRNINQGNCRIWSPGPSGSSGSCGSFPSRYLTPCVIAIVDPPTQRTASAGSTTDRRQQTIVRKCTSLPARRCGEYTAQAAG